MLLGYARISTDDQKMDLQVDALLKAGIEREHIYEEQVSGVKTRRPKLDECLKALRKGDILVVWRLDRLGRSLVDLIKVLHQLQTREIGFKSLTESIDTTIAVGRMIFHVIGAIAQFERDLISERTRAGLKAARARGHRGGRKPKVTPTMMKAARAMLGDPTVTMGDVCSTLKVSPAAMYRAFKRDKEANSLKDLRAAAKKMGRIERVATV